MAELVIDIADGVTMQDLLPDGIGFEIALDGVDGISDPPPIKGENVEHDQADGAFMTPTYFEARVVTVRGTCRAQTPAQLEQFRRAFVNSFLGGPKTVTVTDLGVTWTGTAQRIPGTQPKFRVDGRTGTEAAFQIMFKFPDPYKYGESDRIGPGTHFIDAVPDVYSSFDISNAGNDTPFIPHYYFTVSSLGDAPAGALAVLSLTGTYAQLGFITVPQVGQSVEVTLGSGGDTPWIASLTLNGVPMAPYSLAPGESGGLVLTPGYTDNRAWQIDPGAVAPFQLVMQFVDSQTIQPIAVNGAFTRLTVAYPASGGEAEKFL